MKLTSEACTAFERAINAFVDRELAADDSESLVRHLDECDGCRDYLEDLQLMASLHADAEAGFDEQVVEALVDEHGLFANVTRRLLAEKSEALARLFYELGKAYVLVGGRHRTRQRDVIMQRRPVDIRRAMREGRALSHQGEALQREAGVRERGSLFRRSRQLFDSCRAGHGALANGRRLLEEALRLDPDHHEARFYLGMFYSWTDHDHLARREFGTIYARCGNDVLRMMALQYIGMLHTWIYDHDGAIRCFEEVVASGVEEQDARMFVARFNLAVSCTKAGRTDPATAAFRELVTRRPEQVPQLRRYLARDVELVRLLQGDPDLETHLRQEVPALFAVRAGVDDHEDHDTV